MKAELTKIIHDAIIGKTSTKGAEDAADAIIAALLDMVRPLVFENCQSNDGLLNYRIHIGRGQMNGIFALTCNGSTIGEFGSEAEAEEFAQALNARRRILSALGITEGDG